jgi:plastocyanin
VSSDRLDGSIPHDLRREQLEEIMQRLRMQQVVRPGWCIAVLVAIASAISLASTTLQAQHATGSSPTATGADAAPQVVINNYVFSPASLTVKVGTTVTWINQDDDAHTVDSTQSKFKSATLNKGARFEFRFTEAGEYPFNCRFHPKMTGTIIVQP